MSERPPSVTVCVSDDRQERTDPVDLGRWRTLAEMVLAGEGVAGPAELHLAFVDEGPMAELNQAHLGGEGPTDVLSFPLDAEPDPAGGSGLRLLGDVIVCPAVSARRCTDTRAYEADLALLVVHGVLHVLGMDHAEPDQEGAMVARERHHLAAIGLERGP